MNVQASGASWNFFWKLKVPSPRSACEDAFGDCGQVLMPQASARCQRKSFVLSLLMCTLDGLLSQQTSLRSYKLQQWRIYGCSKSGTHA